MDVTHYTLQPIAPFLRIHLKKKTFNQLKFAYLIYINMLSKHKANLKRTAVYGIRSKI